MKWWNSPSFSPVPKVRIFSKGHIGTKKVNFEFAVKIEIVPFISGWSPHSNFHLVEQNKGLNSANYALLFLFAYSLTSNCQIINMLLTLTTHIIEWWCDALDIESSHVDFQFSCLWGEATRQQKRPWVSLLLESPKLMFGLRFFFLLLLPLQL